MVATAFSAALVSRVSIELDKLFIDPRERRRQPVAFALFVLSAATMVADSFVLPRLYPVFHWALAAMSVAAMGCASLLLIKPRPFSAGIRIGTIVTGLSLALLAPVSFLALNKSPNAWIVLTQNACLSGKWLELGGLLLCRRSRAPSDEELSKAMAITEPIRSRPGIDLRGKDVLLITVDALRADRLSAYGGRGLTPNIDALGQQSAVFVRAYTPAPDTFYAIGSLMTGEFLRSTALLASSASRRTTLPERLSRYGYHTAAFYPPAVSNTDRPEFAELTGRHFGFEYYRVSYASAQDRLKQVDEYLRGQKATDSVFVWVHLFEPHEPYEPPERFVHGKTITALYDGEVMAVDEAVGELTRRFRRERTDATVILTADHGEELGDHGGYYHGTTVYDDQVRVPMIWSSPGTVAPATVQRAVETVDIPTTLLSALGIARDVRMQGEDLGAILRNPSAPAIFYAFSEIGELRMVTDGRYKAIFRSGDNICQLYDLLSDVQERQNLSGDHPEIVTRLRAALARHLAATARLGATAAQAEREWPEALTRARLGDPSVGPDLAPLLGSERAKVRIAAARGCGEVGYTAALPVLSRLRERGSDPASDEAAISALLLGDNDAQRQVLDVLRKSNNPTDPIDIDLTRRAALALSKVGVSTGSRVLIALAEDSKASIVERKRAIAALGELRVGRAVRPLCRLLNDPFLRIDVARALGNIGDKRAIRPLARQLANEPYLPAREAETRAIEKLTDRRARRGLHP
jgi:arylsulfatase A-like enzyme